MGILARQQPLVIAFFAARRPYYSCRRPAPELAIILRHIPAERGEPCFKLSGARGDAVPVSLQREECPAYLEQEATQSLAAVARSQRRRRLTASGGEGYDHGRPTRRLRRRPRWQTVAGPCQCESGSLSACRWRSRRWRWRRRFNLPSESVSACWWQIPLAAAASHLQSHL